MTTKTKRQGKDAPALTPVANPAMAMDEMPAGLWQAAQDEAEHQRQMDVARRVMRENRAVLSELAK